MCKLQHRGWAMARSGWGRSRGGEASRNFTLLLHPCTGANQTPTGKHGACSFLLVPMCTSFLKGDCENEAVTSSPPFLASDLAKHTMGEAHCNLAKDLSESNRLWLQRSSTSFQGTSSHMATCLNPHNKPVAGPGLEPRNSCFPYQCLILDTGASL